MRATVTAAASGPILTIGQIGQPDTSARSFLIRNRTATASIFLETDGPATVANGFEWKTTDAAIEITLEPGQVLNGIVAVAGGDQTLELLESGR